MPVLYVVATPIGNLEDISLRALRVLREVKLIAAEDTRKTRRLLTAYDIKTPMTSYYEHNKLTKLDYILDCLKKGMSPWSPRRACRAFPTPATS